MDLAKFGLDKLTPEQLGILHELTRAKYGSKGSRLITLDEYNKLPDFLKGYAYYLQANSKSSQIPKERPTSDDFKQGYDWAMLEVTETEH